MSSRLCETVFDLSAQSLQVLAHWVQDASYPLLATPHTLFQWLLLDQVMYFIIVGVSVVDLGIHLSHYWLILSLDLVLGSPLHHLSPHILCS